MLLASFFIASSGGIFAFYVGSDDVFEDVAVRRGFIIPTTMMMMTTTAASRVPMTSTTKSKTNVEYRDYADADYVGKGDIVKVWEEEEEEEELRREEGRKRMEEKNGGGGGEVGAPTVSSGNVDQYSENKIYDSRGRDRYPAEDDFWTDEEEEMEEEEEEEEARENNNEGGNGVVKTPPGGFRRRERPSAAVASAAIFTLFSALLYFFDGALKAKFARQGIVGPGLHAQFEWGDDKMKIL